MIHPTALVSKECVLEEGVDIGPGCVLSGPVRLGRGARLIGSVYISGPVTIGENTTIYPFACVGFPGQDFKFKIGDPTAGVAIGKNTILREHVTIHAATKPDKPTVVGDNALMMCGSHVGHDATLSSRAIMVNGSALGGHSFVGEGATLSAHASLHQFGRVGRLAFVSASVAASLDIPPFCLVAVRNVMAGLNLVGLRRAGMSREHITELRRTYREVFRKFVTREDMMRILEERSVSCTPVAEWLQFVKDKKRAICPGHRRKLAFIPGGRDDDEDE